MERTREGLIPIVDTHQHLWDLERLNPPWLSQTPPVMQQSYTIDTYLREARGTGIERAVYMEVDVAVSDRPLERDLVAGLCLRPDVPTAAAVFSGSVDAPDFASELAAIREQDSCRGIRHLAASPDHRARDAALGPDSPPGWRCWRTRACCSTSASVLASLAMPRRSRAAVRATRSS